MNLFLRGLPAMYFNFVILFSVNTELIFYKSYNLKLPYVSLFFVSFSLFKTETVLSTSVNLLFNKVYKCRKYFVPLTRFSYPVHSMLPVFVCHCIFILSNFLNILSAFIIILSVIPPNINQ